MSKFLLMFSALLLAFLLVPVYSASAQQYYTPRNFPSPLSDPNIPNGEENRYISRVNNGETSINRIRTERSEDNFRYIIQNFLEDRVEVTHLYRRTFVPLREETRVDANEFEYEEIRELSRIPRIINEGFISLSIENIPQILRGYPFESPQAIPLNIISASTETEENENETLSDLAITVEYRGEENIVVQGDEYRAHKLELVFQLPGAAAIFSGLIPKTYFWYETEAPYRVLKLEGPDDFQFGGEQRIIRTELLSSRIANN